jgi:hypothetical protein
MEKYIVWLLPDNKKLQIRSFHTEAKSMKDALDNLKNTATFTYKVMGLSGYYNLGGVSKETADKVFVNNSFH